MTSYTYNDSNDYLLSVSSAGSEVDYTYDYGKLTSITHNTSSASDVTYNFVYDEFGNTTSVKVGTQALISHTYGANNGLLTQSTYGNGDTYTPTYDSLDRISSVSYNGIEKYNWVYGADGRIGLHNDLVNDLTWRYEYSMDGSLTSAYADNGERFDYTYDTATGKLLSATVSDGTTSKTTTYNYSDHTNGEKANLIESVVLPTATVTYDYDDFYRTSYDIEVNSSDILTTDYTFVDGIADNSTTVLVESMTTSGSDWSDTLSYTYDCKGNIETVSENGEQKAKYYYDDLNQLVREDNAWTNKTVAYTYDNGGNILNVEEYTLTSASDISSLVASSTDVYEYNDSNWKDKLTSFNGNEITYDEIGNPLTYYNGLTFDWQNGRQLASVSGNGLDIFYTYNADGIRTSKTVNGVTTTYTLEGSNVVKETNGIDTIWYYYDAAGSLTGFELNGTPYYYVSNIHGDITAITDANGNVVVEYIYDSWGKLVSVTGSLADTVGVKNPYRYRGYYYDTETGLYYLNSRYYDSNTKRFINADGYVSTGQGIIGHNMFSYCGNNPTNRIDKAGAFWNAIKNGLKTLWKGIKKWAKNTFGAGQTTTQTVPKYKNSLFPQSFPISVVYGGNKTTIVHTSGDTTKPFSVYYKNEMNAPVKSSKVGLKLNFGKLSVDIGVLGLDNTGIKFSYTDNNVTESIGLRVNLWDFKVGIESSVATENGGIIDTEYSNISVDGYWLFVLVAYIYGQPVPNGGQNPLPAPSY